MCTIERDKQHKSSNNVNESAVCVYIFLALVGDFSRFFFPQNEANIPIGDQKREPSIQAFHKFWHVNCNIMMIQ